MNTGGIVERRTLLGKAQAVKSSVYSVKNYILNNFDPTPENPKIEAANLTSNPLDEILNILEECQSQTEIIKKLLEDLIVSRIK